MTTKWGQSISNDANDVLAYNYFVDETCNCSSGNIAPVGCVAVAMGQIMNYWKYPVLRKDDSCTYSFDWCNMTNVLRVDSPHYHRERNAIARLLKDCAEAVDMSYCYVNACRSFAWPNAAKNALKDVFGYSHNIDKVKRLYYNDNDWNDLLVNNIINGFPVFYAAINSDTAGLFGNKGKINIDAHAFVCDGYNPNTDLFHFNMGWKSLNNGWYNIESLIIGSDCQHFERAIINIYPEEDESLLDYCDFNLYLDSYYHMYYNCLNNNYPLPNDNVPSTATNLFSSSISNSIWSTIANGDSAEYVAHKSISLRPGFYAEKGSNFIARIDPCVSCNTAQPKSDLVNLGPKVSTVFKEFSDSSVDSPLNRDNALLDNITLFPNPCYETISFIGGNVSDISIFDLSGKSVFNWHVIEKNDHKVVLNINSLPPALYIMVLRCIDGTFVVKRFVKMNSLD